MAKYKPLVSTLFIYNKICENVKKLENFEISTYLGEKIFSRGGGGYGNSGYLIGVFRVQI